MVGDKVSKRCQQLLGGEGSESVKKGQVADLE